MLMRPRHPRDRLLTLKASGPDGQLRSPPPEEMHRDVAIPCARPVTGFLFFRYRLQSFKVGADILDQNGMSLVI